MYPQIPLFGDYAVSSYSFFTTLGAVLFAVICYREARRLNFSIDIYWKLFFFVAVFAMIGSKILYSVSFDRARFFSDPIGTLGATGWMLYGALAGGYVAVLFGRMFLKFPLFTALDGMSYGAIFGVGMGRIACFMGGCCGGLPTDSFLGVTFPHGECAVHPTQLYEAGFAFLLFGVLYYIRRGSFFDGLQISLMFIGYGTFRFLVEFIRADSLRPGFQPFTPSQYISILIVLLGTAIILFKRNPKATLIRLRKKAKKW